MKKKDSKELSAGAQAAQALALVVSDCLLNETLREGILFAHEVLTKGEHSLFGDALAAETRAGKRAAVDVIVYKSPAEQAASKKPSGARAPRSAPGRKRPGTTREN